MGTKVWNTLTQSERDYLKRLAQHNGVFIPKNPLDNSHTQDEAYQHLLSLGLVDGEWHERATEAGMDAYHGYVSEQEEIEYLGDVLKELRTAVSKLLLYVNFVPGVLLDVDQYKIDIGVSEPASISNNQVRCDTNLGIGKALSGILELLDKYDDDYQSE